MERRSRTQTRSDAGFGHRSAQLASSAREQFRISAAILACFGLGCAVILFA